MERDPGFPPCLAVPHLIPGYPNSAPLNSQAAVLGISGPVRFSSFGSLDAPESVKALYVLRLYHPDLNEQIDAGARMVDLNWAYETLSDPEQRAAHDATLASAETLEATRGSYRTWDRRRPPEASEPSRAPKPYWSEARPQGWNPLSMRSLLTPTSAEWAALGLVLTMAVLLVSLLLAAPD